MTRHPVAVILSALLLLATPLTHSQNLMSNDTGRCALDIKVNEVNTDQPDATTASLAIDKVLTSNADEDGSRDVSKGDTLTYTLTATNSGGMFLTGVVVSDNLTGDFTGDRAHPACADPLAPGAVCVLTVDYVVRASDLGTTIHNVGSADSDQTERGRTVFALRVWDHEEAERQVLDSAAFDSCLDEAKYAQRVDDDLASGRSMGIRGTPACVLGLTNSEILWDTHHQVLTEDRWQSLPLTVGWHWRQSRYNSRLGFNRSFQA